MGSFTDLIKKCASNDPKKRPTIDQVIEHLETLFQLADIKKKLIQLADETKKKLINPADEKKKLFGCLALPWLI
jgi:serine/threonine protein kinase